MTYRHPGVASPGVDIDELARACAPLAGLRQAVDALRLAVAAVELAGLSGPSAEALVRLATEGERVLATLRSRAAARVAETFSHTRSGHRSPETWLAEVTGSPVGEARRVLDTAERLADLPVLASAVEAGRLSPAQAAEIAGVASAVAPDDRSAVESRLVATATGGATFRQLKEACAAARAAAPDAAERHARVHAARSLRTWTDAEGGSNLALRTTAEAMAPLLAAVEAERRRLFRSCRRSGRQVRFESLAADALCNLGAGAADADRGAGDEDGGSAERRRGGGGRRRGPRAEVVLRVDADALRRGRVGGGEVCEIAGVGPVPVEVVGDAFGDALVRLLVTRGRDVLAVATAGRVVPTLLRLAVLERDAHRCVVPGCDARLGLEIDHVEPLSRGGPTSYPNLQTLCTVHHHGKSARDRLAASGAGARGGGAGGHDPP